MGLLDCISDLVFGFGWRVGILFRCLGDFGRSFRLSRLLGWSLGLGRAFLGLCGLVLYGDIDANNLTVILAVYTMTMQKSIAAINPTYTKSSN